MTDVFAALQDGIQDKHPNVYFDRPENRAMTGTALGAWEIYVRVPTVGKNVRVLGLVLRHVCLLKLYQGHFALIPGELARSVCGVRVRTSYELADPEKFDELLDIISRCASAF